MNSTCLYTNIGMTPFIFQAINYQARDMPCFAGSIRRYNDNLVFWTPCWAKKGI